MLTDQTSYIAMRTFIEAEVETTLAKREQRPPTVRPQDMVELAERMERSLGTDLFVLLEGFAVRAVYRALKGEEAPSDDPEDDRAMDAELRALVPDSTLDLMAEYIEVQVKLHKARSAKRTTDGEARTATQTRGVPMTDYLGVWQQGETYARGSVLTHAGSAWLCLETTQDRPGKSGAWRLISKNDLRQQSEAA